MSIAIHLDTDTDGVCCDCNNPVRPSDDECQNCGSESIDRKVTLSVDAHNIVVWVIERTEIGEWWTCVGTEGFVLDLTDYS